MKISDLMKVKQFTFIIENYEIERDDYLFTQIQISIEEYEEQQKIKDMKFSFTLTVCLSQIKIEEISLLCTNSLDKDTC